MINTSEWIVVSRNQFLIFLGLSILIAGFTAILFFSDNRIFAEYFGSFNPLLMMLFIFLLGVTFLSFLLSRGFSIYQKGNWAGLILSVGLATLFGIFIIFIDIKSPLAEDINVPLPQSLLFYPTMGYVVEILFHVGLLTILLFVSRWALGESRDDQIIWACIIVVALVEPVYQTVLGGERPYPLWLDLIVAMQIFLINLVQLALFKRYDFVTMYSFRLVYYLIWHIGWGHWRLALLF